MAGKIVNEIIGPKGSHDFQAVFFLIFLFVFIFRCPFLVIFPCSCVLLKLVFEGEKRLQEETYLDKMWHF